MLPFNLISLLCLAVGAKATSTLNSIRAVLSDLASTRAKVNDDACKMFILNREGDGGQGEEVIRSLQGVYPTMRISWKAVRGTFTF